MKGCLQYIIELKNNKIQTPVYHIVSVVYGCIVNHSKALVSLNNSIYPQLFDLAFELGSARTACLYRMCRWLDSLVYLRLRPVCRGQVPPSSCSLILKEASPGCSHGSSTPRGWEQRKETWSLGSGPWQHHFPQFLLVRASFKVRPESRSGERDFTSSWELLSQRHHPKCPSTILTSWDPCLCVALPLVNLDCLWDQQNVWVCVGVWHQRLAHTRSCTFHLALLVLSLWGKSDAISWGNSGSLWRGPHR